MTYNVQVHIYSRQACNKRLGGTVVEFWARRCRTDAAAASLVVEVDRGGACGRVCPVSGRHASACPSRLDWERSREGKTTYALTWFGLLYHHLSDFYTLRPPPPPCASLPSCHPSFSSLLVLLVLLLSASATGPALPPPRPGSGQLQLRPALMTARHDVACIRSGSSIARTRQREARHLEESASRENHHRHT